jgi:hypothetical protein
MSFTRVPSATAAPASRRLAQDASDGDARAALVTAPSLHPAGEVLHSGHDL